MRFRHANLNIDFYLSGLKICRPSLSITASSQSRQKHSSIRTVTFVKLPQVTALKLCFFHSRCTQIRREHHSDSGNQIPTQYSDESRDPKETVGGVEGMAHKSIWSGLK